MNQLNESFKNILDEQSKINKGGIAMSDQVNKISFFGIGEAGKVPASTTQDEFEAVRLQPHHSPDYPNGRKLSCGCTVYYKTDVMSASMGTSCLDCYDNMSD